MNSVKLLLKYSIEVYESYNGTIHGVEEHLERCLVKNKVQNTFWYPCILCVDDEKNKVVW